MAFTITPGRFVDNGAPVAVAGGPWTLPDPLRPTVRLADVRAYAIKSQVTWNGSAWVLA
jgi:hypothetical protein